MLELNAQTIEHEFTTMTAEEVDTLYFIPADSQEALERNQVTLEAEFQRMGEQLWEEELLGLDELNVDVDETEGLMEELRDIGVLNEDETIAQIIHGVCPGQNWYPYPHKTLCLLDVFDTLPRLRFSEAQMKMVLWLLKNTGARDVPSFDGFRKVQQHLRDLCSAKVNEHTSDLGNIFSSISLHDLAARDFANPTTAPLITLYPEDVGSGPVSEMWQMPNGRWMEIPQDMLPPSILVNNKRFYIHEIAELEDSRWVIPQLWLMSSGILHAVCYIAQRRQIGDQLMISMACKRIRVPVSKFQVTHLELLARFRSIQFEDSERSLEFAKRIPNVNRQIDDGEDLFTSWWAPWSDDVSGARSKQYQKHINIYGHHINLPGRLLQQQFHVRPISSSPHAGSLEQFKPIVQQVRQSHSKPIRTLNASTGRPCGLRLFIPDLPADNPQQSEEASHIGHMALLKCRNCKPGECGIFRATAEGYEDFYKTGTPRNVHEIRSCVLEQIKLASFGVKDPVESLQTKTGVKDKIAQHWIDILLAEARKRQQATPSHCRTEISNDLLAWLNSQTAQPYNPLLDVPFLDPSQDTLVEILHTILLGVEKYGWHNLHSNWDEKQRETFATRLQSTNIQGLNVPPIRAEYMMQYRNALIGKHFKTLIQTAAFHVYGLVTESQFRLVRALGELGAVLWISEIDDIEVYLGDLTVLIDNVLDAFADIDPSKILVKIKLHMLIHLPSQIRRRGPAVRFSTEVDEAFNAVFRLCSVLSNHQAASRDICQKLADLDRVKHMITGGLWQDNGVWVAAGSEVKSLLATTPVLQSHMGWSSQATWMPGVVQGEPSAKDLDGRRTRRRVSSRLTETPLHTSRNPSLIPLPSESHWVKGVQTTSVTGNKCTPGSWVVCRYSHKDQQSGISRDQGIIGKIVSLYIPEAFGSSGQGVVVLREYSVGEVLHHRLHMPVLRPSSDSSLLVICSKDIQFEINVQHDCEHAGCRADGVEFRIQERKQSQSTRKTMVHCYSTDSVFLINMHALHNARLVRKFLPRQLIKPQHLYKDRRERHARFGAELVVTQAAKRAETNRKAAETRARKQAQKDSLAQQAQYAFEPPQK
ncbi:hypothetical protein AAF712_008373 [Marasmius tenuissimus]|uniref:Uncharacterized protein n=1 Tax=Marasmius tenuissimus TaxID=585030 RepID=A0ABR2ZTP0_9AGAR